MRGLALAAALGALCAGCRPGHEEQARISVERTNGWLVHWFAGGQGDSVAALFTETGRWESPNGAPAEGRQAIATRVRELSALKAVLEQRTDSLEVVGDSAVEHGGWRLSFSPIGMEMVFTDSGRYRARWRVVERRWLLQELVAHSTLMPSDSGR